MGGKGKLRCYQAPYLTFLQPLTRLLLILHQYDPTIEESYQTTIDIEGKAMQVEILDTAGQDAYTPLRETFMHTGDGFLLVYSIVDDQTLEELREIREQILRVHPDRKVGQNLLHLYTP